MIPIRPYYLKHEKLNLPEFTAEGKLGNLAENAYYEALNVMFNINCVIRHDKPVFAAGGEYADSWTRDGSYNSYAAGSLFAPGITENTLRSLVADGMVNGAIGNGEFNDLQFWDKQLWIIAAYRHWLLTSDRKFLEFAVPVARKTLQYQEKHYFVPEYQLFRGPGFFLDSIGALPRPYADPDRGPCDSCVVSNPDAVKIMTLSTNAIYVQSYHDAAALCRAAGGLEREAADFDGKGKALADVIRNRFWEGAKNGIPAYFIHGTGPQKGMPAYFQEGSGVGFALTFGVADSVQAETIFRNIHLEPKGIPVIWPSLGNDYLGSGRFGSTDSGYHTPQNITIWPQVNGIWMLGCAAYGQTELFGSELENLCRLISDNGGIYEIYHARTGCPKLWGHPAKKHQNWGAAAVLSVICSGLMGLRFAEDGLHFSPVLPENFGSAALTGLHYFGNLLAIKIAGTGSRIVTCRIDGKTAAPFLARETAGEHTVELTLEP